MSTKKSTMNFNNNIASLTFPVSPPPLPLKRITLDVSSQNNVQPLAQHAQDKFTIQTKHS